MLYKQQHLYFAFSKVGREDLVLRRSIPMKCYKPNFKTCLVLHINKNNLNTKYSSEWGIEHTTVEIRVKCCPTALMALKYCDLFKIIFIQKQ